MLHMNRKKLSIMPFMLFHEMGQHIYMKKKCGVSENPLLLVATRITANDAAIGKQPLTTVSGFNLFDTCFINLGIFPK